MKDFFKQLLKPLNLVYLIGLTALITVCLFLEGGKVFSLFFAGVLALFLYKEYTSYNKQV